MLSIFIEQKIDIVSVNYYPDLLFLLRGKFCPSSWIRVCVVHKTGACFETRFNGNL